MSLLVPSVASSSLLDFEQNLTKPSDSLNVLGSCKVGLIRQSHSLPFYTKNQSWPTNALQHSVRELGSRYNGHVSPNTLPRFYDDSKVNHDQLQRFVAEFVQSNQSGFINVTQSHHESSFVSTLKDWSHNHLVEYVRQVSNVESEDVDHVAFHKNSESWAAFIYLAQTPAAKEMFGIPSDQEINDLVKRGQLSPSQQALFKNFQDIQTLSQIHLHFQKQAGRNCNLLSLIQEAHREKERNNSLQERKTIAEVSPSVPHLALLGCVERLVHASSPSGSSDEFSNPNQVFENDWAVNAFKNGLLDLSANSDFMKIDARLKKLGKWVRRAEHRPNFFYRLLPTKKKTPFQAMKYGTLGASRGDVEKFRANYLTQSEKLHGWVNQLRVVNNDGLSGFRKWVQWWRFRSANRAVIKLQRVLDSEFSSVNDVQVAQNTDTEQENATEQKNDTQQKQGNQKYSASQSQLFNQARHSIRQLEKLKKFVQNNGVVACGEQLQSNNHAGSNSDERRSLNLEKPVSLVSIDEKIRQFKRLIGQSDEVLEAYQHTGKQTQEHEGQSTSQGDAASQEGHRILNGLLGVADHIQGASRWKMFSGGVVGVGTKGITTTLTSVALALLARLKLDLRWLRTRTAGVEVAMNAYNMELMLYSSTQTGSQMGVGASVGPSIGVAEITGGANVKFKSVESKQNEGVVLRMYRERGKEPRDRFKDMTTRLFELSQDPNNSQAGYVLKTLLQEFPDLSTNLIGESSEYKRQHSASLECNAGVVAGSFKVGPTAEVGVEYQSQIQKDHVDKTGFLKVERHVLGRGVRGFAEARLDVRFNAIRDPFRLTPLTLDNLAMSADFLAAGRQVRRDIAYHHHRVLPVSFYEIEYQSFDDFKNAVLSNKAAWDKRHAPKITPENPDPVLDFLQKAYQNLQSVHTFAARWELKPEVANLVNRYNSAILLQERATSLEVQEEVDNYKNKVKALLDDPASYNPTSFRVYERQDINETTGLHAAARLEAVRQAEGSYVHSRLM